MSLASWQHGLREIVRSFASKVDFAERTFDRGLYLFLYRLLPPQADHLLGQEWRRILLLRRYFQRRAQAGNAVEADAKHRLTGCMHSGAKGSCVGALLGVLAALANNLKVFEDWDGRVFFYPRLQFFRDLIPFLIKGSLRGALLTLSAVGIVEAARSAGIAEQVSGRGGVQSVARSGPRAVLGVSQSADIATVKKAYRRLALKFHPDKNRHLQPDDMRAVEAKFREVQDAYEKVVGKEEFEATNSEMFSAEFFEVTDEQLVTVAGVAKLAFMGVALAAYARS